MGTIKLLSREDDFFEGAFTEFERRYEGLGKEIYRLMQKRLPDVYNCLKFYKRVALFFFVGLNYSFQGFSARQHSSNLFNQAIA